MERAVSKLDVLDGAFAILTTGKGKVMRSVPIEFTNDHKSVLDQCSSKGYTSRSELQKTLGWPLSRVNAAIDFLVQREIAWVDMQSPEPTYWILGLLSGSTAQG